MERILYTAVVLNETSHKKLINFLRATFSGISDWEKIAHHMTVNLGPVKPEYAEYLGEEFSMTVNEVGFDNKCIGVKVSTDLVTDNNFTHVTLAVNRNNGAKPKDTNFIEKWVYLEEVGFSPFEIEGILTEVKK